jgi:hypothetical protein
VSEFENVDQTNNNVVRDTDIGEVSDFESIYGDYMYFSTNMKKKKAKHQRPG